MKIKMMTVLVSLAVAIACTGCHSRSDLDSDNVKESFTTETVQVTTEKTTTTTTATTSFERTAKTTTTTATMAVTTIATENTETKPTETPDSDSSFNEQEHSNFQNPESPVSNEELSNEQPEQEVIAIPKEEPMQTELATESEQTEIPVVTEGVIEFPFIPIG